jgi:SAM-dependent methyltransferase
MLQFILYNKIMQLQNLQHKIDISKINKDSLYNGIPMMCTYNVHQTIFKKFSELNLKKDIKILVLGSGTGAFDQRLVDHGYKNVISVEFIPENFMAKGTTLLSLDLNKDFDNLGKFDVVFAIEIIEHLENQFHFIRNIKNILDDDGVLFLSTPNVENTFSRIKFFLLKRLHFFSREDLYGTGHINPIFLHIFEFNLEQVNMYVKNTFTNANI